jgi:hypothetical protein
MAVGSLSSLRSIQRAGADAVGIASGALLPYTNIWFEGTETGG